MVPGRIAQASSKLPDLKVLVGNGGKKQSAKQEAALLRMTDLQLECRLLLLDSWTPPDVLNCVMNVDKPVFGPRW